MTSGIYQIKNVINDHRYIGSAKNIADRWKAHIRHLRKIKHCNKHLQYAWNKYGEDNFEFSILEECEENQLINREQYYLDISKHEYNICQKAGNSLGTKHSLEARRKISLAKKGKPLSPEHRAKLVVISTNMSLETRAKISVAGKGRVFTPEHCAKISAANKGHVVTSETRAKLRTINLGKHHSEETCIKISAIWKGRKHSPETREKLSVLGKGRKHSIESRKKMSLSAKKRGISAETRIKIAETRKSKGEKNERGEN